MIDSFCFAALFPSLILTLSQTSSLLHLPCVLPCISIASSLLQNRFSVMADQQFLEFVASTNGFCHGGEEFMLKSLAVVCRCPLVEQTEEFRTHFLLSKLAPNLRTYHRQAALHGYALLLPGVLQQRAPQILRTAFMEGQLRFMEQHAMPVPPIRLWGKGKSQCDFLRTLLPATWDVQDLEEMACPPIKELNSHPWQQTTVGKARALALWLDEHQNNS